MFFDDKSDVFNWVYGKVQTRANFNNSAINKILKVAIINETKSCIRCSDVVSLVDRMTGYNKAEYIDRLYSENAKVKKIMDELIEMDTKLYNFEEQIENEIIKLNEYNEEIEDEDILY